MKTKLGFFFISSGILMILSSLIIIGYNFYEEYKAYNNSHGMLTNLTETIKDRNSIDTIPDYILNPQMEMPEVEINGQKCIGVLEIPSLKRSLPVISQWSYPKLKKSPCRYKGSAYQDNLIIMAHNYVSHFRKIGELKIGEQIIFTDADNNIFKYKVVEIETLKPRAIEEMESGEWDLTLFTCTIGGSYRVTVRCEKIE